VIHEATEERQTDKDGEHLDEKKGSRIHFKETKGLERVVAKADGAEGDKAKVVALFEGHFRLQVAAEHALCPVRAYADVAVQEAEGNEQLVPSFLLCRRLGCRLCRRGRTAAAVTDGLRHLAADEEHRGSNPVDGRRHLTHDDSDTYAVEDD